MEREAIAAMSSAFDLTKQLLAGTLPPNTINETVQELKLKAGTSRISVEDAGLFGDAITALMNGIDSYSSAAGNVREWCGLAKSLLAVYKRSEVPTTRKSLQLKALANQITTLRQMQENFNRFFSSLEQAAGKVAIVQDHVKNKDDADNKAIQSLAAATGEKLNRAHTQSIEYNEKLKNQIETLENLKVQFGASESNVSTTELRSSANDSVQKLIDNCVEYYNKSS